MMRRFLVVVCLAVMMFSVGCAELSQNKAGYVKLFNGRDLTGWETSGNAKWFVEKGNLVGTQGANNAPGDLFTTLGRTGNLAALERERRLHSIGATTDSFERRLKHTLCPRYELTNIISDRV